MPHPRPMRSTLLVVLLVASALGAAGCFSKNATPNTYTFSASGGKVSPGWAYDGTGLEAGSATLAGNLDNAKNAGGVNVSFDYNGAHYVVQFASFAQSKPFQDGGVRFNFPEHGDSGNGDASLPTVHATAAAWGTATVVKDEFPVPGGKTSDAWNAHLMLLSDSPRNADGKITKADGTSPYDPNAPKDAKVATGKPQAIFYIQSPDGPTAVRSPLNDSKTLTFQGPPSTQTVAIPSEKGAALLVVNFTFTGGNGPLPPVGNATVTLRDANGNATKQQTFAFTPNAPTTGTIQLASNQITGAYNLTVDGTGAFNVKVDTLLTYDDHPFLVVTWDAYTIS
jgi:hypothetical protein